MELFLNIFIGIVTGIVSGVIVTLYFSWKSEIDQTYFFWLHYLSRAFAKSEIFLPIDGARQLKAIGGQNSEFGETFAKINAKLHPLDMQKKLQSNEAKIADLSVQAWNQLDKWYDDINRHRYRYFIKHIFFRKQ